MIRQLIRRVANGENLDQADMTLVMEEILEGQASPPQTAAFLMALRLKVETPDEIAAAAQSVAKHFPRIRAPRDVVVLDRDEINLDEETVAKTCSLNGAETRTFNISTATALVAAGGGLTVAKYGARAESTFCGSANVVASLGVNLDLTHTEVERGLRQIGLGFLYANLFHTPLAMLTQVREEIGVRTIFNLVGPLVNPAGGSRQILGVYLPERCALMADVLKLLGREEAMVIYGQDTLDELSNTGPTLIYHLKNGQIRSYELNPEDVGLTKARPEDISGGGAEGNAAIIRKILDGEQGPRRDVVMLNAAAAFMVAGAAEDFKQGLELAGRSIDSGRARQKLDDLIEFTANCGVYQHKDVS